MIVRNNMKKYLSLLICLVIIVLVSGCTQMTGEFVGDTGTPATTQSQKTCRDVQESYVETVPYEEEECTSVPYTDQECETKQLVYKSSIDEISRDVKCTKEHSECEEYILGICAKAKKVCDEYRETCSFDITNLDREKGTWYFDWYRNCRAQQPACTLTQPTKVLEHGYMLSLDPTETKTSRVTIIYRADGQEYCSAVFTSIPTKQICRDVIKIKEECKTVTKYKEETKYRTVSKCD